VSAYKQEAAINSEVDLHDATKSVSFLVQLADILDAPPRIETNAGEATGTDEPTGAYFRGGPAQGPMNLTKAQAQHIAVLLGFGLGAVSSAAVAGSVAAYKHTCTPIRDGLDERRPVPTFTAGQQIGGVIEKLRYASCALDSVILDFTKDQWVKATGQIKATGKMSSNLGEDTITALDNVTTLTLTARVNGATAGERLDSVQRIIAEYPADSGIWVDVAFSAVTAGSAGPPLVPSDITITALGGAGASTSYKALYADRESGTGWETFAAKRVETPLLVNSMAVVVGGTWNNTTKTLSGGHSHLGDISQVTYTLNNALTPEFRPSGGAEDANYANFFSSGGRTQKLSFKRDLWDAINRLRLRAGDYFSVHIVCTGDVIPGETTERYRLEMFFPRCMFLTAQPGVDGNKLSEQLDIQVLEDETLGSVLAFVTNGVAAYAAV
jgi:hypothetical protein